MKEKFESKGYWYLPENPDNKIAGILKYLPGEKIMLELIGGFEGAEGFFTSLIKKKTAPIIFGEISNSKKVTLIRCFQTGSLNYSCSFPLVNFSIGLVLENIHLLNPTEKIFNKISFGLPLLNEFINRSFIKEEIRYRANEPVFVEIGYDNNDLNDLSVKVDENISIDFKFNCIQTIDESFEKKINQFSSAYINAQDEECYEFLIQKINLLKSFIELATRSSLNFNFINLHVGFNNENEENTSPIRLYFQNINDEKFPKPHVFFFTYDKISHSFQNIIQNWFAIDDDIAPIREHLIQSISPSERFSSLDFLIIVQALEGFHTRFRKKKDKDLKTRLMSLRDEFSEIEFLNIDDDEIDQATATRNYYSHFYHKKGNVVGIGLMFQLSRKLRALLTCCLIKQIGIDVEIININLLT